SYKGVEFTDCRIPSLDEVLELGAGRCQLNIEIKNGPVHYPQIEEIIIDRIKAHRCREQVIISSFDHRAISRCHHLDAGIRLAYLIAHMPLEMAALLPSYRLYALHPNYAYITHELINECHQLGLKVNAWGTNNPDDWKRFADWGIDGIISDYVAELHAMLLALPR
ncbi:MAG: glycerophosphodiester phosphodiesterase, partial [Methanomassiliicoccales archaeon]